MLSNDSAAEFGDTHGSGMGGGIVAGVYQQAESMRPTLYGQRWAVVAGHPIVSDIGARILEAGGNATDAGVACGFAANVVEVEMCNLGGIAPILVREPGAATVHAIAGVGSWSAEVNVEALRRTHNGKLPLGGAPSIIPAAVSAWLTALERFGSMPLDQVIEPAIRLAIDGVLLDPRTASHLAVMGRGFAQWPSSLAVYQPHGTPLTAGEILRQPALGGTLCLLRDAARGAAAVGAPRDRAIRAAHDAFYTGQLADTMVSFVRAHGGTLTAADLAGYRAAVDTAPAGDFGRWRVHVPPTWSQGGIIPLALGILERRGIREIPRHSPRYAHEVVEALKLAFSERERTFGDPAFEADPLPELLSATHLDALAARVSEQALPNLPTLPQAGPSLPSTTSIVVVDQAGGVFAASPSDTIDGAPIIPELGIICSPRGVQSRFDRTHPNRVRAGARPCVTPAAMIALPQDGHDAVWASACPGGDIIVQAIVQSMLEADVYGLLPQQAVEAPRLFASNFPGGFHPHPSGDRLVLLEAGFGREVAAGLRARGHTVLDWPANEFDAGSVQTIIATRNREGARVLAAGADSRRTAYARTQ